VRVLLDPTQNFHPIHFGQFQIEQHYPGSLLEAALRVRAAANEKIRRLFAVRCRLNMIGQSLLVQGVQGQLDEVQIIFNQEYFYVLSYHAAPL